MPAPKITHTELAHYTYNHINDTTASQYILTCRSDDEGNFHSERKIAYSDDDQGYARGGGLLSVLELRHLHRLSLAHG